MMTKHFAMMTLLFAFSTVSSIARANDGMASEIFEMIQRGSDVDVTLKIWDPGDPGMNYRWSLDRVTEEASVPVFEDRQFSPEDADDVGETFCRMWWPVDDPESYCPGSADCNDCDGDGTAECYGLCNTPYFFTFTDACVPAGAVTYQPSIFMNGEWVAQEWLGKSLTVAAWEGACEETPDPMDTETDEQTDTETDDLGAPETVDPNDGENGADTDGENGGNCSLIRVGMERSGGLVGWFLGGLFQ